MTKTKIFSYILLMTICITTSCNADRDGIYIAQSTHNYGAIDIGYSKYFELEVENFSEDTRKIEKIIIFNTLNNEFWVEGPNTLISVPGKSKKYLNVWFEPITEGDKKIFIQIVTQSGKVFNLKLSGIAVGYPDVTIPETSLDFGSGFINYDKTQFLQIVNSGTGITSLNDIELTGDNTLDYTIGCSSYPIDLNPRFSNPGNYILEIPITFNPVFKGDSTALLILDIGADNKKYYVSLKGFGKEPAPEIQISDTDYDYGKVNVGYHASKEFKVSNIGVEDLGISLIEIVAVNSSDFSITEVKTSMGSVLISPYLTKIEPGKSILITVEFKPILQGYTHQANLEISHDLSVDPAKIELSGDSRQSIVINECQTSDMPSGFGDWIEIRNTGSSIVDISGWQIECWQGTTLEVQYTFPLGSNLSGYQHLVADDYSTTGNNLPHFYIGHNLLWNRGGMYPGNYEVILKDSNGVGIDYICFGNANTAIAQHIPASISWNPSDFIQLTTGMHYIYRTNDQNDFSSNGWASGYGSGTPLAANPGQ